MLSRRDFLSATAAAGAALAAQGPQRAAAQATGRQIVDAQVHLWKAESPDWKWVPGARPQLPEPFTIEKLVPMMNEAGVNRVVIVPPSWIGDRNDYGIEAVKRYPDRFAVMGRIPLQDPKSADLLPKWKEQPGMLGVRVTFNSPTQAAWLTDGTADWFWAAAEKNGIAVMMLGGKKSEFGRIAEKHPQLTMIMDHMGLTTDIARSGGTAAAIAELAALARHSNVSVKLSATPAYSAEAYPWRDMTAHIQRLYDSFGPQRCYWGTDVTNSFDKATYRQRITHFTEELRFLSEADKDQIMGRAILARLKWS